MKVFKKQKLFSLSTLILGIAIFTVGVFSPKYFFHAATAAIERQNIFSTDNSFPVLPGNLALNKTQEQSIFEINRVLSQEIQKILSQEQLQQFTSGLSKGLTLRPSLSGLTLTKEQKKQLKIVLYSTQVQIERVLTPKQLKYIRQQ